MPCPIRFGPAPRDHDALATRSGNGLVLVGVISLVMVRRGAGELGGAGVDRLERGHDAEPLAASAHLKLIGPGQVPDLHIGQTHALKQPERLRVKPVKRHPAKVLLDGDDIAHAVDEPGVDARGLVHALGAPPAAQRFCHIEDAILRGAADQVVEAILLQHVLAFAVGVQAGAPVLQRAHGLAHRLLERAADRHDLAHGLHARGQHIIGALELLEGEARRLHHAIVDGGLEACRRSLGDIVDDLIERVSDGKARRGLGNGETGSLRRKRRGARYARVHLDDHPCGRFAGSRRTARSTRPFPRPPSQG